VVGGTVVGGRVVVVVVVGAGVVVVVGTLVGAGLDAALGGGLLLAPHAAIPSAPGRMRTPTAHLRIRSIFTVASPAS
jgi:hypothetical protein